MNEINLEQVRAAMFTDPSVQAVDDLRLVPAKEHGRAIAATITVAAPSVDLDLVHAVTARVLADRGSQFRSGDYQDYLAANGLLCSMSAVGHCGDNAACEGFFGLLKRERIYRTTYPTLDAARSDVFEYIERRHNPRMRRRRVKQDQKFSALSKQSVISG